MKIYGDLKSGNCYKVKLVCALLNIDHTWIDVDILQGDTQTQDYLEKNPNGKIPLLELSDGTVISESNAIINFLAFNTPLFPNEKLSMARVLQWQFFEQYSHEPYIAVARYIKLYLGLPDDKKAEFDAKQAGGHKALKVMEQQLSQTNYIAGDSLTNADISLYAYTHVAEEGGFSLAGYPSICQWLLRIEQAPNFKSMSELIMED